MRRMPLTLANFSARRSGVDAALLAAWIVGVVIGATVLAGAPMYFRTLERLAVVDALDSLGVVDKNISVTSREVPFSATAFARASEGIAAAAEHLGPMLDSVGHAVRSPRMWLSQTEIATPASVISGTTVPSADSVTEEVPTPSRAFYEHLTGLTERVQYVSGQPPRPEVSVDGGIRTAEAALLLESAEAGDVQVGDVLETSIIELGLGRTRVVVTGLFVPHDPSEEFWLGLTDALLTPEPLAQGLPAPIVLFLAGDAIFDLTAGGPATLAQGWWFLYLDRAAIESQRLGEVIESLDAFEESAGTVVSEATTFTVLGTRFAKVQRRALFGGVPVLILGVTLAVLATYQMLMISGLVAERRKADMGLLRSRGINSFQAMHAYAVDAAVIILVPVLAGPFLAMLVVSQMGRLPMYSGITDGNALPVELSTVQFAWAAVAGLIPLLILIVPAVRGVAASPIAPRPDARPWFQRFSLDLFVMLLGGVMLWEFQARGAFIFGGSEGSQSTDVTLLLAPTVLTIGGTLALLRVLPLVMSPVARLVAMRSPAWAAVGVWQLARSPYRHAWPLILLVLGVGVSVLAATVALTMDRSNSDRIAYRTVGDVRITGLPAASDTRGELLDALRAVPGVNAVTIALRMSGRAGTTDDAVPFTMLAVEPGQLARIAWYREDFAESSLGDLLESVEVTGLSEPTELPADSTAVGLWARTEPSELGLRLWIRLRDARGRSETVEVDPATGGDGWRYWDAAVPPELVQPVELASVLVYEPVQGDAGTRSRVFLDDLVAVTPNGERHLLAPFEELTQWAALPTSQGFDTSLVLTSEGSGPLGPHTGHSVGLIELGTGTDAGVRGIFRTGPSPEVPAVMDKALLDSVGLDVGDRFVARLSGRFVPVRVASSVALFPPFDPDEGGFAVADASAVLDYLSLRGPVSGGMSAEAFLALNPNAYQEALAAVRGILPLGATVEDRRSLHEQSLVSPLAVAGWRGVAVIAAAVALLLSAAGLATYLLYQLREARFEWAVLRTLGFPRGAFVGLVAVEHLAIAVLGVGIGTMAGLAAGRVTVAAMTHTETGEPVLPAFALATQWGLVGIMYATLGAVAVVMLTMSARAVARLPVASVSRDAG